jgi:predicted AlkP superfamily pyrophosphatase or phosphodiesterase
MEPDSAKGDIVVTDAVVAHFGEQTPTVVFVQLDEVDHQGHVAGHAATVPEYIDALETVDAQIGEMLDAVQARPTYDQEAWLVVVTTDHGGTGMGIGHGGQSDAERTIFIIASGGTVRRGHTISPGPGHTAVPPTVMAHLGLAIDPAWGWESGPFGF